MSDLPANQKLVEVLLREGLLTEEQARRVLVAVEGGRDLTWALSHLPLVEPLRFLRAQSLAGTNPIPTGLPNPALTPIPGNVSGVGTPIAPRTPNRSPQESEESPVEPSIKTLELDLDTNYGMGFEQVGRPVQAPTPFTEGKSPPISPPPSPPPLGVSAAPPPPSPAMTPLPTTHPEAASGSTLPPLDDPGVDPASYQRPGIVAATYDLADDEGIPLVQRVNALLTEALEEGIRVVDICPESEGYLLLFRTGSGSSGRSRPLAAEEAVRIGNRLKVMARIEPWRKPPQKGTFNILWNKRHHRVFINLVSWPENPDTQRTVVHII